MTQANERVTFDPSHISEYAKWELCRVMHYAMQRFYADPENVRKYEEWLKEQKGEKQ